MHFCLEADLQKMCILQFFANHPPDKNAHRLKDFEAMCIFVWRKIFQKCAFYSVKCTFFANHPFHKNENRLQILKNVEFEAMCIFVERVICKKCAFYTVKCAFLENFSPDKNAHHLKILKN